MAWCAASPLARPGLFCHSHPMNDRSTTAGGLFLMLAILIGAFWGLSVGEPMLGILRGTGIGIVLAVVIWLIDRRRRRTDR